MKPWNSSEAAQVEPVSDNASEQVNVDAGAAVRIQVASIVAHHTFRQSKRCVRLLEYLVDRTLAGQVESLKERVLGIEVFGRTPDYDTSTDPIVRTTATEIRKRLAQYYHEEPATNAVRIELVSGSYVPRFEFAEPAAKPIADEPAPAPRAVEPAIDPGNSPAGQRRRWLFFAAAVLLTAIAGGAFYLVQLRRMSPEERFWGPMMHAAEPVPICMGAPSSAAGNVAPEEARRQINALLEGQSVPDDAWQPGANPNDRPSIPLSDASIGPMMGNFLGQHRVRVAFRNAYQTTLADLGGRPVILVGLFDNPWTLRLTSKLRFRPHLEIQGNQMWIEDSEHPERHNWLVHWGSPYAATEDDYAIVTRVQDHNTGSIVVAIGGLGLHGTETAGVFVTHPEYLAALGPEIADPNRNVQVVLRSPVINGAIGPPQVLAVHYW